jgi:hypothetical protein
VRFAEPQKEGAIVTAPIAACAASHLLA